MSTVVTADDTSSNHWDWSNSCNWISFNAIRQCKVSTEANGLDRKPLKALGETSVTLSHNVKTCIHDIATYICGGKVQKQILKV